MLFIGAIYVQYILYKLSINAIAYRGVFDFF